MNYYRKYELEDRLGINKTTLTRWIKYFHEFIPESKQGDIWVYGPEIIPVLNRIKDLRQQLYGRSTIKRILAEEGYHNFVKN